MPQLKLAQDNKQRHTSIPYCKLTLVDNIHLEIKSNKLWLNYQYCNNGSNMKQTQQTPNQNEDIWNQNYLLAPKQQNFDEVSITKKLNKIICTQLSTQSSYKRQLICNQCKLNFNNIIKLSICTKKQLSQIQQLLGLNKQVFQTKILLAAIKQCEKINKYCLSKLQIQQKYQFELFTLQCSNCKNLEMLILANNKRSLNSMAPKKSKTNSLLNIMNMILNNLAQNFKNAAFQKMVYKVQSLMEEMKSDKEADNNNKIQIVFKKLLQNIQKSLKLVLHQLNLQNNNKRQKQEFQYLLCSNPSVNNLKQSQTMIKSSPRKFTTKQNYIQELIKKKNTQRSYIINLNRKDRCQLILHNPNDGKKFVNERYTSRSITKNNSKAGVLLNEKAQAKEINHDKIQKIKIVRRKNQSNNKNILQLKETYQNKTDHLNSSNTKSMADHSLKVGQKRIFTQGNNSGSAPKNRKTSKQRLFGTQSIKTQAKKQNMKIRQKDNKQNNLQKQLYIINKLKQIRNASYQGYNEENLQKQLNRSRNKIPWNEISMISMQIAKQHIPQSLKSQTDFHHQPYIIAIDQKYQAKEAIKQNQNLILDLNQINLYTYKINMQKLCPTQNSDSTVRNNQKIEQVWGRIQCQFVNIMDPIGQCINNVKQLCKKQGIISLKQLYLLYKKFFYMRTTFLCSLQSQTEPILPTLTQPLWHQILKSPEYIQRVNNVQEENKFILKTLQKMQKKVLPSVEINEDKQKNANKKTNKEIYKVIIDDETVYDQFFNQMLHSNITIFIKLFLENEEKQGKLELQDNKDIGGRKKILMQYGNSILMAVMSELEGNQQDKIRKWLNQTMNKPCSIQVLNKYLHEVQLMFQ